MSTVQGSLVAGAPGKTTVTMPLNWLESALEAANDTRPGPGDAIDGAAKELVHYDRWGVTPGSPVTLRDDYM